MQKFSNRAFLACLLAGLLAVPLGVTLWSRKETTAYYESRALAKFPAITWESLWDGSFGADFESWLSDHIPGRTTLLKADTAVQLNVLKRPVVNDMIPGGDVLLPKLEFGAYSPETYKNIVGPIADNFAKLDAHIAANGGDFLFVGLPEQRVYFQDEFPDDMNSHKEEAQVADDIFAKALTDRGIDFLDMRTVFDDAGHPANYYSAVDHHYTYYGAYAAYRAILDDLNAGGWDLPVLTEDDLEFRELPNPYIGSRNKKLYNLWPNTEKAVIGIQKEPVAFTRTDNGQPSDRPLFIVKDDPVLPTTYDLYMGGDFGETVLKTDRPDLPNVLIFGDSFTNAMETLLYASFNETHILDLRHYKERSLKDYIADYQPDIVLCVMNDTFYYTTTGNGNVWEE